MNPDDCSCDFVHASSPTCRSWAESQGAVPEGLRMFPAPTTAAEKVKRWQRDVRDGFHRPKRGPACEREDVKEGWREVTFTVRLKGYGKLELVEETAARLLHNLLRLNVGTDRKPDGARTPKFTLYTSGGRRVLDEDHDEKPDDGELAYMLTKKS